MPTSARQFKGCAHKHVALLAPAQQELQQQLQHQLQHLLHHRRPQLPPAVLALLLDGLALRLGARVLLQPFLLISQMRRNSLQ